MYKTKQMSFNRKEKPMCSCEDEYVFKKKEYQVN